MRACCSAFCTSYDCTRDESGAAHEIYCGIKRCQADSDDSVFWDPMLWGRYGVGLSPVRPVRLVGVIGRLEGRQLPVVWRRSAPIPIDGKCGGALHPVDGRSFLRVLVRPRPIGAVGLQVTAISRVLQCIRRGLCSCSNVPLGSSLQCNRRGFRLRLNVPLKTQTAPDSENMSQNTHFYHMLRRRARSGRLSCYLQIPAICALPCRSSLSWDTHLQDNRRLRKFIHVRSRPLDGPFQLLQRRHGCAHRPVPARHCREC
jgi:hypothetical protein